MALFKPARRIDVLLYLSALAVVLVLSINRTTERVAEESRRGIDELRAVLAARGDWMRAVSQATGVPLPAGVHRSGEHASQNDVSPYPQ
ncbi:MAG: hypothetical protein ACK5Q5_12615 [Planctomycetaceae bacterium]